MSANRSPLAVAVVVGSVFLVEVGPFLVFFLPGLWLSRLDLVFRLAPGVLRGYAQGEASSGWFRGLGCSLGRAGPAVWRVLIAASCVLKPLRLRSLLRLAFQVGQCTSSALSLPY